MSMVKHDDKRFILEQNWPHWPVLPLKRKDNSLEKKNLGVIIGSMDGLPGTIVYHVYMYDMKGTDFKTCPQTKYETLDALLADGWEVD